MNPVAIASRVRRLLSQTSNPHLDKDKNKLIAIAIARALSVYFALPTSAVPSVGIHFTRTYSDPLKEILGKINEGIVIDIMGTVDLTFKFYEMRYNLVYKAQDFLTTLPIIAAAMPDYFPQDVRRVIEAEVSRLRNDQGLVDVNSRQYVDYYSSWFGLIGEITAAMAEADAKTNGSNTLTTVI